MWKGSILQTLTLNLNVIWKKCENVTGNIFFVSFDEFEA